MSCRAEGAIVQWLANVTYLSCFNGDKLCLSHVIITLGTCLFFCPIAKPGNIFRDHTITATDLSAESNLIPIGRISTSHFSNERHPPRFHFFVGRFSFFRPFPRRLPLVPVHRTCRRSFSRTDHDHEKVNLVRVRLLFSNRIVRFCIENKICTSQAKP